MKRNLLYAIILTSMVLIGCSKDEDVQVATLSIEGIEVESSYKTAVVTWNIQSNATIQEAILELSADSSFAQFKETKMAKIDKQNNTYRAQLSGLTEGTKYYIRCKALNKVNSCLSESSTFSTQSYRLAEIRSDSISNITTTSADFYGSLCSWGTDTIPSVGFYFGTHPDITEADSCLPVSIDDSADTISFQYVLSNLEDNTTYYMRAYAKNNKGVAWGDELAFTTIQIVLPSLSRTIITDVTYTSATCKSSIIFDGGSSITSCGFCYSTSSNPTITDSKVSSNSKSGEFICSLEGLIEGTTYYVRAYATNNKATSYSEQVIFMTTAYQVPMVTTSVVSNISYTSASCGGKVTDDGGQTVTERGICYATTQNPTISNTKIASGSGIGSFTCNLTGLQDGTIYYVRAYATNSKGTSYGDQVQFSTVACGPPTISTSNITDITYTTATCGGNVTADGGQTVTERGICYAATQTPTILNTKITSGSGIGSFTCNLTELMAGKKYYVRAYATNSKGTSYGEEKSFITYEGDINAIIRYSASQELQETTSSSSAGLHINAFGNASIVLHDFSNGVGLIVFDKALTEIGVSAFDGCTGLTSITIPNSVISIGNHAFYNCSGLTSITIPNSVTSIGSTAFSGCTGLTSITIPNSVTSIGPGTFRDCTGLTSIIIPNSVSSIGSSAFSGCTDLTSITIPNSVTSIGSTAFSGCTGLTSITIPNSVTSIGVYAFKDCTGLTSVTIPNSVISIERCAFTGCSGLTSITVDADNMNYCSKHGVLFNKDITVLIQYPKGKSDMSYVIPDSVTSIGAGAFRDCTGLTSITIPNSVTRIEMDAFWGCTGLTSITIPNSVTRIGGSAFSGCTGFTYLRCEAVNPPSLSVGSFNNVTKHIPLYVPSLSVDTYRAASGWSDFTNIQPISE